MIADQPVLGPAVPGTDYVITDVSPYGRGRRDVWIRDGVIVAVAAAPSPLREQRHCLAASGLVMLPGLVDLHTHLREPGAEQAETIETGTRAAAAGGYTDVFAMANTTPVTDSVDRLRNIRRIAATSAHARVYPVAAITAGLDGRQLSPMEDLAADGVTVFSDDGKCVDDAGLMRRALQIAAAGDITVAQHSQHGQLAGAAQINGGAVAERTGLAPWPSVAEETIIARDAILAGEAGARLHVCHVSTRGSVEVVRWAKCQGWNVTAEVTPHHLQLTDRMASDADPRFKVNPPLRTEQDVHALRAALVDGTIDVVATDHAPHPADRKACAWPDAAFGMTGLETALPVVSEVLTRSGAVDWIRLSAVMSSTPARIGHISDRAGRGLEPGEPATFILVDPTREWTIHGEDGHSKSTNTPFEGMTMRTKVVVTVVAGTPTYDDGLVSQVP